ncbi:MAG: hypothetical protein J6C16_01525, partial [Clostridia bacterium]|nr:hypothetical protein [Clostridia bacterium]
MKYRNEYMGEVKKLVNDVLNITEAVNILRTELLQENGKNKDKIRSLLYMLCSYCRDVDVRAKGVKFEIEKDEDAEIEYDIP